MRITQPTIKQIFKKHWPDFVTTYQNLPPHILNTREKMLTCSAPEKLGYHAYQCPEHPWECRFIYNTCKCNFCNSCSKILADKLIS